MDSTLLIIGAFMVAAIFLRLTGVFKAGPTLGEREASLLQIAQQNGLDFYYTFHPAAAKAQDQFVSATTPRGLTDDQIDSLLKSDFDDANDFVGRTDPFVLQFQLFDPFNKGTHNKATEIMVGSAKGRDLYSFRYEYETSSGDERTIYVYSVAAVRSPLNLPQVVIRNSTLFTKLGEHLGVKAVNFESNEFNQRYCVHCDDAKLAFDVIDPKVIDLLLSVPTWEWQINGPWTLIAEKVKEHDAAESLQRLAAIQTLLEAMPPYVAQDHGIMPYWQGPLDLAL